MTSDFRCLDDFPAVDNIEIGDQCSGDKQMASPVDIAEGKCDMEDIVLQLEPREGVCCVCDATFEDLVE